jgi:uncharacterized membrane protein
MKLVFQKYPVDIILFELWGIILLPIILLNDIMILRIIVGLPFLLFIPGYLLIFNLFPTKKRITPLERIGLSIGLSIAIVSLLGLILNYTPWGVRLEPILFSLFFLAEILGLIAIYRWKNTNPKQRLILTLEIPISRSNRKIDNILTIVLLISIIIALASILYIIAIPKTGEAFTELYILPPDKNATNYPRDILKGDNISIVIGLLNHEYKTMHYTIEIWLIDETMVFNESMHQNDTVYNHAWFMQKLNVKLNHTQITNEKPYVNGWEYNYTFSIAKKGHFKVAFLLYTTTTPDYSHEWDYSNIIKQRINQAYRETHLWFYIYEG